jgi:hypothetical protein
LDPLIKRNRVMRGVEARAALAFATIVTLCLGVYLVDSVGAVVQPTPAGIKRKGAHRPLTGGSSNKV